MFSARCFEGSCQSAVRDHPTFFSNPIKTFFLPVHADHGHNAREG